MRIIHEIFFFLFDIIELNYRIYGKQAIQQAWKQYYDIS